MVIRFWTAYTSRLLANSAKFKKRTDRRPFFFWMDSFFFLISVVASELLMYFYFKSYPEPVYRVNSLLYTVK